MKNTKSEMTIRRLRENEVLLVVNSKGKLECVYALQCGKLYRITYKNKNQRTEVIYMEDLSATLK